jgi:hypothetical protein
MKRVVTVESLIVVAYELKVFFLASLEFRMSRYKK